MGKSDRSVMAATVLLALAGAVCPAQTIRSQVTVTVTDPSGKPIPDAMVQLTSMRTGGTGNPYAGMTDEDGNFTAKIVIDGAPYQLVVQREGFAGVISQVPAQAPATIAVQLTPGVQAADAQPAASAATATDTGAPLDAGPPQALQGAAATGPAPADAPAASTWETIKGALFTILLALAPLISFFVLRSISVRLVLSYMMRKAPQGSSQPLPEGTPGDSRPADLEFLNLNHTNGVLLNGTAQHRLERTEAGGRPTFAPFFLSVLAAFVVWVAVAAGKAISTPELRQALLPAVGVGALLFIVEMVINGYWYWFLKRLAPWMCVAPCLLTLGVGIAIWKLAQVPPYLTLLPGAAQGLTGGILVRRQLRKLSAGGNQRLVILRVFGSDKSTAFTFGTLMDRWRFVGSFLTIVDPSYIRYQFAAISPFQWRRTAATTFWYGLAAGILGLAVTLASPLYADKLPAALKAMPDKERYEMLMNGGYLVMIPLAILPIFLYVTRRFAKSQAEAAARIQSAIAEARVPRRGIFRGMPMWCFDDVWKPSVRQILTNAEAVLMDLRGFTPDRKGCAYEIGELIDRFPIERVLFLVQQDADKEALYGLIRERWARMSADSPNRGIERPVLKVYETHPKAKARQVRKDVARILGLISACVDEKFPAGAPPKALVQFA